jgi:long-subunit acyl-CoA synthetase (AMP-forming)
LSQDTGTTLREQSTGDGRPIDALTLPEAFQRTVASYPDRVAYRTIGGDVELTWTRLAERVRAVAGGLAAHGVGKGATVAILARNTIENHLVDYSLAHLGAVPFGIFTSSSPEQIAYQVQHADATVVVTESRFLDSVRAAIARLGDLVRHVVVLDGSRPEGVETTLEAVEAAGDPDFDFDAAWRAVAPEAIECIIYTSGTTGPPKAAQWSNRMIMSGMRSIDQAIPLPRRAILSFLPMAHAGGRNNAHHYALAYGATVTVCPDVNDVPRALVDVHPDLFSSSPRVYEKLQVAIEALIEAEPAERRTKLKAAVELGLRFSHAEEAGSAESLAELESLRAEREAGIELLRPILAKVGLDRLDVVIIGGATVAPDLVHFFRAVGTPMLEAYGATEVMLNVFNRVDDFKTGTAGKALPDVELRLAEDGEILCRGPLNFSGYLKDPDKSAEVMDEDGWVRTGDIGRLDGDGFLTIIDRKKEIIINSHGKNMSPAVIESAIIEESTLIAQIVAIGEARRYVTALITLDPQAVQTFARSHHPELAGCSSDEVARSEAVRQEIQQAIGRGNARLNRNEQVKKFAIVGNAWEVGGDELTPTAKVKRRVINQRYADEIEALYAE